MKFVHISDLHIGKRLNEYSLIEDQRYILGEIINIIKKELPDCVFIAGDVYDKTTPSAEAVSLLDDFLEELARTEARVFIISGNHDSAERIAYGGGAFKKQGIYMSPVFDGRIETGVITDEYGSVNIYLLPFIKPANVKRFFENESIESYTDAIAAVVKALDISEDERNVIIAHQFVTGAERRESEEVSVGGLDNVEDWVFEPFDYVALGHIHKCQCVKRDTLCYSGTPLKYSASEIGDEKCVIVGEIKEKGIVEISRVPLVPMRDFVGLRGKLDELMKGENKKDYVHITLTDEENVVDAYGKLKGNYPFMTELLFDREKKIREVSGRVNADKSPAEQFDEFFLAINGKSLTEEQRRTVSDLFVEIKENDK